MIDQRHTTHNYSQVSLVMSSNIIRNKNVYYCCVISVLSGLIERPFIYSCQNFIINRLIKLLPLSLHIPPPDIANNGSLKRPRRTTLNNSTMFLRRSYHHHHTSLESLTTSVLAGSKRELRFSFTLSFLFSSITEIFQFLSSITVSSS